MGQKRSKAFRTLVSILFIGGVFFLSSCRGEPGQDVSSGLVNWEKSPTEEGGCSGENALPDMDTSEDITDPLPTHLSINGSYIQLSAKAEETALNHDILGMFETRDGLMILYLSEEQAVGKVIFQLLNPANGRQLLRMDYSVQGSIRYVLDVRSLSYGENDLLIATSAGTYLFDLDDLAKPPENYLLSPNLREEMGELTAEDADGFIYDLMHEMFDLYLPDKKMVYANNEGVFTAGLDGSSPAKMADQPGEDDWPVETGGSENSGSTKVVCSAPRFFDQGTKVVMNLTNYAAPGQIIGFAVLDLEQEILFVENFYSPESLIGQLEEWNTFVHKVYEGFDYGDETTVVLNISVESKDGGVERLDVFFDVKAGRVIKTSLSSKGITSEYKTLAETSYVTGPDGEIRLYDLELETYLRPSVELGGAGYRPLAISRKYVLESVWALGEETGEVKILIAIPGT